MPTFCLREGECSSRGGAERTERMALFRLSKSVSKNYTVSFACSCFAFFAFFFESFLVFCARLRVVTFDFTTPPTKRRRLFSQKSLHIISHLHLIIAEISNAHEKSFLTFQREREFRCAEQQQQQQQQRLLFSSSLFFFKIVLSRARARV